MIKINNHIKEISCKLYNENNIYLGKIKNQLAFLDVLVQINEQNITGCYIVFKGIKYYIVNGAIVGKPSGLFDLVYQKAVQIKNIHGQRNA